MRCRPLRTEALDTRHRGRSDLSCNPAHTHLAIRLTTKLSSTVLASGMNQSRPNSLNLKVARQAAQPQALQQRRQAVDEHQREEDDDEPAEHGVPARSEPVRPVSARKPHGLPRIARAQGQHLEQLAHFMLHDQFGRCRPLCLREAAPF